MFCDDGFFCYLTKYFHVAPNGRTAVSDELERNWTLSWPIAPEYFPGGPDKTNGLRGEIRKCGIPEYDSGLLAV